MFRRENNPEAIKGDVIGEALVELRTRVEEIGWKTGGGYGGDGHPMCLGNHIGVMAAKRGEEGYSYLSALLRYQVPPWTGLSSSPFAEKLARALKFPSTEEIWHWNDEFAWFRHGRGKRAVLKRINEGIEDRNKLVIYEAHNAALKEDAEREKLYVPVEWKPRTVSGEDRERIRA